MVDPILKALQAHTKEPEEVDWQKRFEEVSDKFWELSKKYMDRTDDLIEARAENKRLKDVILRLEQRCATAEGREGVDEIVTINPSHAAADAFWEYWRVNGETHRHGHYESTWGAINAAIKVGGLFDDSESYDGPKHANEECLQTVESTGRPVLYGEAAGNLVTCNDCGKLLYRSAKDLHKCGEGNGG